MKPETKLWQLLKKNTPKIKWTRLESWSSEPQIYWDTMINVVFLW
jgi:hypothetical protein